MSEIETKVNLTAKVHMHGHRPTIGEVRRMIESVLSGAPTKPTYLGTWSGRSVWTHGDLRAFADNAPHGEWHVICSPAAIGDMPDHKAILVVDALTTFLERLRDPQRPECLGPNGLKPCPTCGKWPEDFFDHHNRGLCCNHECGGKRGHGCYHCHPRGVAVAPEPEPRHVGWAGRQRAEVWLCADGRHAGEACADANTHGLRACWMNSKWVDVVSPCRIYVTQVALDDLRARCPTWQAKPEPMYTADQMAAALAKAEREGRRQETSGNAGESMALARGIRDRRIGIGVISSFRFTGNGHEAVVQFDGCIGWCDADALVGADGSDAKSLIGRHCVVALTPNGRTVMRLANHDERAVTRIPTEVWRSPSGRVTVEPERAPAVEFDSIPAEAPTAVRDEGDVNFVRAFKRFQSILQDGMRVHVDALESRGPNGDGQADPGEQACGLGFWGRDPAREHDRSTSILVREGERWALRLRPTDTHTGLLSGMKAVAQLCALGSVAREHDGQVVVDAVNEARAAIKLGWPAASQVPAIEAAFHGWQVALCRAADEGELPW